VLPLLPTVVSSLAGKLIQFGDFTLNITGMELLHRGNKVVLTTGEIELVDTLIALS